MTHQPPIAARAHLAPCNPPSNAKPTDTAAKSVRSCSGACSVAVNGCVTGCHAARRSGPSDCAPTAQLSGQPETEDSPETGDSLMSRVVWGCLAVLYALAFGALLRGCAG